jgi:hypothetical protein|tara:strand:- start:197 stop:478 length:282 start_codon:yes stop_codon:yes gene_type:complete
MAYAQKGDPLKKQKDSLNFKNKTVEKFTDYPAYDDLAADDLARWMTKAEYDKSTKHMKKIGLQVGAGGMPYFKQTGTMVAPERKKRKNPMDKL